MTDREAMQQALEALEEINKLSIGEHAICLPGEIDTAMDALRERLGQPERGCAECGKSGGWALYCVACMEKVPRREWVGLTEAERIDIIDEEITAQSTEHFALAQAVEAKLRGKNT